MQIEIIERAQKIKLLLMDCDGVLTDGRLYFTEQGEEVKVFHVRDGQGLVMWHQAGFHSGIISGRTSRIIEKRANELGILYVRIGSQDKLKDFAEILEKANVSLEEVAYIGDDIPDIDLMKTVGFGITVADAVAEVFPFAKYTTAAKGGLGAVREVTDLLLKAKSLLD
jgi:3-deoxy-D-manno-octulosonate 8-phosphate phosphatase (KDO 8-P phosphatase)